MSLQIDYNPLQGTVTQLNGYVTEVPRPPLNRWVQCFWQLTVPAGGYCYRSIPDNCVDWIFTLPAPEENFIVTPFVTPQVFNLTGPVAYFGIRFRVLGQLGVIPVPVGEWSAEADTIDPADLISEPLLDNLCRMAARENTFTERCHQTTQALLAVIKQPSIDPRLANYLRYCQRHASSVVNLSDHQCAEFGISARQLRRLTHLHLGLSPREFARVLRFQTTLRLMKETPSSQEWNQAYYDQPHFIREFKQLTGFTPKQFSTLSVLYNTHDL